MADVDLSFSRLQSFQRCPWLYHLVFDEGWRSGPTGSSALGKSLHEALAKFLEDSNTDRSMSRLHETFDEVWVNEGFAGPQETFQAYESGRTMLENFWKIDQYRTSKVLFTEKGFGFDWNGIHIQGSLDRVDQASDGVYEIVEYKTRGDHWTRERIEKDLQMTFYWWGVEEGLGLKPVRLKFYFLSSGESIVANRDESHRQDLQQRLLNMAEKVRLKDFTPNHAHCSYCEIGKRCTNFKKEL